MIRQALIKPEVKADFVKQSSFSRVQRTENTFMSNLAGADSTTNGRAFDYGFSTTPVHLSSPSITVQPKLKIGDADDKYEQEADRVADQVMRIPEQSISSWSCVRASLSSSAESNSIHRKCVSCSGDEELIQRKPTAVGGKELNSNASSQINSISGGGRSMSKLERNFFEPRFRSDFSNVRIHDNGRANQLASSISARAFTLGNNVVFGAGEYSPRSEAGKRLLAHELTHVKQQGGQSRLIQRHATEQARLNGVCYEDSELEPTPNAKHPELHPTYEQWLASFAGLVEFRSDDTVEGQTASNHFRVLGTQSRQLGDTSVIDVVNHTPEEDHDHADETVAITVSGRALNGEEFIDHPTNAWVVNCLPSNLRETAFQLPSDCADIAVILRHVWLAAHNRTESYGRWRVGTGAREIVVGDRTGSSNQRLVRGLIRDVFSGNVSRMVSGYENTSGSRLTDFNQIQNLLHPGDILAWEHKKVTSRRNGRVRARRTGGHVQTISDIPRNGNTITAINVLQGNQPIFSDSASQILTSRNQNPDPKLREGRRLRDLPSRRLERNSVSLNNIQDPVSGEQIWGTIDKHADDGSVSEFTTIVSAGPPTSTSQPRVRRRGRQRVRRISDWFSTLRSASLANLQGTLGRY